MSKGNIYWFTGQPAHGKTVLGKKLVELLQSEKRNWRKDVFHIDGDDLRALPSIKITPNKEELITSEELSY